MAKRRDLVDWLYEALSGVGGRGRIPDLCRYIYEHHEHELRASGDLFYTWQYDVRWAGHKLRDAGKMIHEPKGVWRLL